MGTERKFIQNIALGIIDCWHRMIVFICHVILLHRSFEVVCQSIHEFKCIQVISPCNPKSKNYHLLVTFITYFLASPPFVQMAKSFVIFPDSIVLMQTCSKVSANFSKAGLLSILPRWERPRVHAKIEAKYISMRDSFSGPDKLFEYYLPIGLVDVSRPFWWFR